jgi:hypothetical protein
MKSYILPLLLLTFLAIPQQLLSHSGGLDSKCGHNCSDQSKQKGLCSGYHYHYSGGCVPKRSDSANISENQTDRAAMHEEGNGVAKDRIQAFAWYNIAAANGSETARNKVKGMSSSLTVQEFEQGRLLAYIWTTEEPGLLVTPNSDIFLPNKAG